jgi:hypothetical protein
MQKNSKKNIVYSIIKRLVFFCCLVIAIFQINSFSVYATNVINNINTDNIKDPTEIQNIFSRLDIYLRKSIVGVSNVLNEWFGQFTNQETQFGQQVSDKSNSTILNDSSINQGSNEGVMVVPINKDQDIQSIKDKLKSIISDNFILDNVQREGYGVIKPVFKNDKESNQDYLFMMVPVIPDPVKQ